MTTSNSTTGADLEGDGLRERKAQQNVDFAKEPESDDGVSEEDEKDKKTIGRTPDGTGKCLCTLLAGSLVPYAGITRSESILP